MSIKANYVILAADPHDDAQETLSGIDNICNDLSALAQIAQGIEQHERCRACDKHNSEKSFFVNAIIVLRDAQKAYIERRKELGYSLTGSEGVSNEEAVDCIEA